MLRKKNLLLILIALVVLISIPAAYFASKIYQYNVQHWFPQYIIETIDGRYSEDRLSQVEHIMFIIVDHHEPGCNQKDIDFSKNWVERYSENVQGITDDYGRKFQYTWFYPWDHRCEAVMYNLNSMVFDDYGEIEFHWHHGNDTNESFTAKLDDGIKWFNSFGALRPVGESVKPQFAFIHGNWALDNSTTEKHCGVNREIDILQRAGSYADFTFSTLSTMAQPAMFNRIYYAIDSDSNKSYDTGEEASKNVQGAGYMIFQGPSSFDPTDLRFEVGALEKKSHYKPHRSDLWLRHSSFVKGKPEWRFIKVHTHGITASNVILGKELHQMASDLSKLAKGHGAKLHYVTTREAYNLVKAAEAGASGDPHDLLDFNLLPPLNKFVNLSQRFEDISYSKDHIYLQRSEHRYTTIKFKSHPVLIEVSGEILSLSYQANDGHSPSMQITATSTVTIKAKDPINFLAQVVRENEKNNEIIYTIHRDKVTNRR